MNWLLKTLFKSQLQEIRDSLAITLYQEMNCIETDESIIADSLYDAFYPFVSNEIEL
tara:strand:+ start:318 stop:488 length:171 start_codon:yes stop_codon:yes gene_type:complete